jgi:hypothetical protein
MAQRGRWWWQAAVSVRDASVMSSARRARTTLRPSAAVESGPAIFRVKGKPQPAALSARQALCGRLPACCVARLGVRVRGGAVRTRESGVSQHTRRGSRRAHHVGEYNPGSSSASAAVVLRAALHLAHAFFSRGSAAATRTRTAAASLACSHHITPWPPSPCPRSQRRPTHGARPPSRRARTACCRPTLVRAARVQIGRA